MKYYMIAGEASGDLHGSKLMKGLKLQDPQVEFRFFGGDLMAEEGGTLVEHYKDTAIMGFIKVIANLGKISRNLRKCRQDIYDYQPDALILIDYSGFNLRIARWAKPAGFKVIYYISPKVWVWNSRRINIIRENVDRLYVILPFEVDFYEQHDYPVYYVGNPILDAVVEGMAVTETRQAFLSRNGLDKRPIIALLAGSRRQEIKYCLPEMLAVIPEFQEYQFVIAAAPGIPRDFYHRIIGDTPVGIVSDQTYPLLAQAHTAVVTSGTATLETALFRVPQAVIYKMGALTYHIGRHFIKPKFFSLVNLIMASPVVNEILQNQVSQKVSSELRKLLYDQEYRQGMLDHYAELREKMGEPGAHLRLAKQVAAFTRETPTQGERVTV